VSSCAARKGGEGRGSRCWVCWGGEALGSSARRWGQSFEPHMVDMHRLSAFAQSPNQLTTQRSARSDGKGVSKKKRPVIKAPAVGDVLWFCQGCDQVLPGGEEGQAAKCGPGRLTL
jgi:hypothetical protein